jgi:LmbE family N-acetylglucosaminyl deacetylase
VTAIVGAGTAEDVWTEWLEERPWPVLDLAAVGGRRVVVLAAHPDDEVLGVGGLLAALAARRHKLVLVWVTDGEASHPGSTAIPRAELGARRREESQRAVAQLGLKPVATHHLALPDGRVAEHPRELDDALHHIMCPGDLVIAPWSSDGHPDHDAVGAAAAATPGIVTWHYPIWMWHWASPHDPDIPWSRLHATKVPDLATKAAAVSEFVSQVEPLGPQPADAPILPPHVLARFRRSREWVLT